MPAKGREAAADGIEEKHENAGEHDADGGQRDGGEKTESDFSGDEVEGPDGGEKNQGEPDDGAAGGASGGSVYAHGNGPEGTKNEMRCGSRERLLVKLFKLFMERRKLRSS